MGSVPVVFALLGTSHLLLEEYANDIMGTGKWLERKQACHDFHALLFPHAEIIGLNGIQ